MEQKSLHVCILLGIELPVIIFAYLFSCLVLLLCTSYASVLWSRMVFQGNQWKILYFPLPDKWYSFWLPLHGRLVQRWRWLLVIPRRIMWNIFLRLLRSVYQLVYHAPWIPCGMVPNVTGIPTQKTLPFALLHHPRGFHCHSFPSSSTTTMKQAAAPSGTDPDATSDTM